MDLLKHAYSITKLIVNVNICDIHRIYESKGLYFIKVNVNNSPNLLNQDD